MSKAVEKRFLETGHPKDLTLFFAAGQGHRDGTGGDHYGHEGMVKRVIGGHSVAARLGELALANKIEAYNFPQGVITHMSQGYRSTQYRHTDARRAEHLRGSKKWRGKAK